MNVKNDINKTIFREYDIRGEYKTQIDEDTAYTIGLAYGTKIRSLNKNMCIVGHDNRLSGESLTNALLKGITETGVNVKYLGLVTTPMYYFACIHEKIDTGVMVTASHNPVNDNGFKIALENYDNACGDKVQELYRIACKKEFSKGTGIIEDLDIRNDYIEYFSHDINIGKRLKVVLDSANASTSIIIKDLFDNLNVDCTYINDVSDGSFPSHHPDPSVPKNLEQVQKKVLEINADLGLSFDGDGDRLGIVNEKGEIVNIDTFMALIWDDIMPKVSNKTALFDVKCSKQLEDEILALGGIPYIYRTGNSYQKNKIKEMDLAFGGELSGHVFFRDRWGGFDDGMYAGLRLIEILSNTDKPLSELTEHMTKYYSTPEIKIKTTEDKKFKIVDGVKKVVEKQNLNTITIDGVRINYEDGWALVRASNTGPNLTLRFEAKTEDRLEEIKNYYTNLISEIEKDL